MKKMRAKHIGNIVGINEISTLNFWKAVLAEVVASAIYIIIVCGAGLHIPPFPPPSLLHMSLTVGFTVAVLASAFWNVSGGHFNPAVTFGLTISGKVSIVKCVFYVIAQCAGSEY